MSKKSTQPKQASGESLGKTQGDQPVDFDSAMDQIESIIEQIESGSIGLEEQLAAYERGAGLLKKCRSMLDAAEQRVELIDAELERLEGSGQGADETAAED